MLTVILAGQSFIGTAQAASQSEVSNIDRTAVVDCPTARGTAFAVSDGLYMTARHVVVDCPNPEIISNSGARVAGTTVYRDSSFDVALIKTATTVTQVVTFNPNPLKPEPVEIVGSPIDGLVLSAGAITSISTDGEITELHLTIPADHGNSGGPVFAQAQLAGMVVQKNFNTGDVIALALPTLKSALDRYKISQLDKKKAAPAPVRILGRDFSQTNLLVSSIFINLFFIAIVVAIVIRNRRPKYLVSKKRIRIQVTE